MREIKFRAWDKENKIFADSYAIGRDGVPFSMGEGDCEDPLRGHSDLKNLELIQFTGLKDKNGKEIYEGDIMSSEMGNGRIIWIGCSGKFVLEGDNFLINPWDGYEVIGNIFENHNLLTK